MNNYIQVYYGIFFIRKKKWGNHSSECFQVTRLLHDVSHACVTLIFRHKLYSCLSFTLIFLLRPEGEYTDSVALQYICSHIARGIIPLHTVLKNDCNKQSINHVYLIRNINEMSKQKPIATLENVTFQMIHSSFRSTLFPFSSKMTKSCFVLNKRNSTFIHNLQKKIIHKNSEIHSTDSSGIRLRNTSGV